MHALRRFAARAVAVVVIAVTGLPLGTSGTAAAQDQERRPVRPLTCHKEVCPLPTSPCEKLESDRCVRGRCPAIVPADDGTACSLAAGCTVGDSCRSGICTAGLPLQCTSPTAVCTPFLGCATDCGANGCTVQGGGSGNPTLTVPSGALSTSVRITITDLGGDANDASVFRVYELRPSGTQFAVPATIDLPAPALAAGQVPVIETSTDGVTWAAVPTTLTNGRITGPIDHFSFCRSRVVTPQLGKPFAVVDMIAFPDVATTLTPGGIVTPGCNAVDFYGFCATVRNDTASTVTSQPARVVGWMCYSGTYTGYPTPWPPLDPAYEGAHCATPITCTQFDDVTLSFPGGLAPGASTVVTINMSDVALIPKTSECFYGSGMLFGVDLLFGEPTATAPSLGMRSAKVGPVVETAPGVYVPYAGGYPLLKFRPDGSPVKNFLLDGRF